MWQGVTQQAKVLPDLGCPSPSEASRVQTGKGSADDGDSLLLFLVGFSLSLSSRILSSLRGKHLPDAQFCFICFSQRADFCFFYSSCEIRLSLFLPNQPGRPIPASSISSCLPWASRSLPVPISSLSVTDSHLGHGTQPASE